MYMQSKAQVKVSKAMSLETGAHLQKHHMSKIIDMSLTFRSFLRAPIYLFIYWFLLCFVSMINMSSNLLTNQRGTTQCGQLWAPGEQISRTISPCMAENLYSLNSDCPFLLLSVPSTSHCCLCFHVFGCHGDPMWMKASSICLPESALVHLAEHPPGLPI